MKALNVSPRTNALFIVASLFLCETILMLFFHENFIQNHLVLIFVDSLFLSVLLLPIIYFFTYKPLSSANAELKKALEEIKTLKGLLPICVNCKKIRDNQECWHQVEAYISENSELILNHSLCPECRKQLEP